MEEPTASIFIVAALKINSAGSRRRISKDNNIPFITHSFYADELLATRLTLKLDWHHFVVLCTALHFCCCYPCFDTSFYIHGGCAISWWEGTHLL